MPLMKLACTALERVPVTRAKIIDNLMRNFHQDLVFCRFPGDSDLTKGVLGKISISFYGIYFGWVWYLNAFEFVFFISFRLIALLMLFESMIEFKKKFQYGAETVDILFHCQKYCLPAKNIIICSLWKEKLEKEAESVCNLHETVFGFKPIAYWTFYGNYYKPKNVLATLLEIKHDVIDSNTEQIYWN